jgi:hypothetical protein
MAPGPRFLFWQRWLYVSSLLFAAFGVAFAFFGNRFPLSLYNRMVAQALWGTGEFPQDAERFRAFFYGPMGATIACCYILLAFIARHPFQAREPWARNAILAAFGVWVVIDSALCIRFGAYPQVYIINAFSIAVKALPLLFTWKDFRPSSPGPGSGPGTG